MSDRSKAVGRTGHHPTTSPPLRIEHLSYAFGEVEVIQDINLEILQDEFVAVVGPSGCGKTTLLNVISGFLQPVSGAVAHSGRVRMVYQEDGLLPWYTLAQNIALGLRSVKERAERERLLNEMLEWIGLSDFADYYPHQLSGGMRRRAELARALAGDTDILLMDEPFSSLDYLTRLRMRCELATMLLEYPRTVVLVTHDIEEAAQLADRILILSGRPARIRYELRISLPRPRDLTHPRVVEAMHCILTELGLEKNGSREGSMGVWEYGRMGEWENGRMGEWENQEPRPCVPASPRPDGEPEIEGES